MTQVPYRTNNPDPININFYDNSVSAACSIDWKGSAQPVRSNFYVSQFIEKQTENPVSIELLALQVFPHTIMTDWKGFSNAVETIIDGVQMEAAPTISHQSYFQVITGLYSKATSVDPANPLVCPPVGGGGSVSNGFLVSCLPDGSMVQNQTPVTNLFFIAVPMGDVKQDPSPVGTLSCRS